MKMTLQYVIQLTAWSFKMTRKFIIIRKAVGHSRSALERSARSMASGVKYIVVTQMLVMSR